MKSRYFGCALLLGLCGCAEQQQVVDITTIPQIQADLKRQIGVYIAAVSAREVYLKAHPDEQAVYWCGNGSLDFQITSVKLDLTTSLDKSDTISGSATVPLVTGSVGPSVSGSNDVANSQELTFTEYAWNPAAQPDDVRALPFSDKDLASAPIAQSLLGLRNGLIAAARKSPLGAKGPQACFSDVPIETLLVGAEPPKSGTADAGNSFKLGVTVTNTANEGITLKLGPLSLGNTLTQKMVAANAITVGFKPVHLIAADNQAAPLHVAALDSDVIRLALMQVGKPEDPCKDNPDPPASCYGRGGPIHTMDVPQSREPGKGKDRAPASAPSAPEPKGATKKVRPGPQ